MKAALSIALFTAAVGICFTLNADAQEKGPAKPHSPPAKPVPTQPSQTLTPPKKSYFCTDKPNGNYCGENNEPRLFRCTDGFISSSQACSNGCDSERNRCKAE